MSAAARARVLQLVERVVPTVDPGVRWTCSDRSARGGGVVALEQRQSVDRAFDLVTEGFPLETDIASAVPTQWQERWRLRLQWSAPEAASRETIARRVAADVRSIVRVLAVPGNWADVIDYLDTRTSNPTPEIVTGAGGVRVAVRVSLTLLVTYQETP